MPNAASLAQSLYASWLANADNACCFCSMKAPTSNIVAPTTGWLTPNKRHRQSCARASEASATDHASAR